MSDDKPKLRFCGLCGKNKPSGDFDSFELSRIGHIRIMYGGCKSCGVIVHNAIRIIAYTIQKEREKVTGVMETKRP